MVRSLKSPARVTSNHDEKASTRSRPSGRPDRARWIGPTSSWSSASSTTRAMTRSASPGVGPAVAVLDAFAAVGEGRLVAVVAVGDHHRRRPHRLAHGVDQRRRRRSPTARGARRPRRWPPRAAGSSRSNVLVRPGGQRQAPDGGEVGPGGPQQVEAVALGLGQGLLVGEDLRRAPIVDAQRADHPVGGVPVRRGHPVGVEGRGGVADQDARPPATARAGGRRWRSGRARPGGRARAARPGWSWRCAGRPGGPAPRARPRRREGRSPWTDRPGRCRTGDRRTVRIGAWPLA